ncbi:hypothetical protein [Streptomyces mirabilis]|uniref:hypothetical protein n=1 Tax=Streptomyces mirabilis TaxID=68239 RepID=UPI0036C613CC
MGTTLTAIPRRATVLASKAAVLAAATGIAAGTAILASLATARWILPGNNFTPEAGYPSCPSPTPPPSEPPSAPPSA